LCFRQTRRNISRTGLEDEADKNLGLNTPQERFIHQFRGVQVGGKDDQRVERYLDLLSTRQGEKVNAAVQRNDPRLSNSSGLIR